MFTFITIRETICLFMLEKGKKIDKGSKEEFFGNTKNHRAQAFLKKVFRENV